MNSILASVLLSAAILAALTAQPAAATFRDVPKDYWAKSSIDAAVATGLMQGDAYGRMNPNKPVTRAQFAVMLVRGLGLSSSSKGSLNGYSDVPADFWCAKELGIASSLGIMQGTNGKMLPNATISRQQSATMIYRALEMKSSGTSISKFTDASNIQSYAAEAISTLSTRGYMGGTSSGAFNPAGTTTRAQTAAVLTRIAKVWATGSLNSQTIQGNVVISGADARISNCHITGDVIVANGFDGYKLTLDNTTVDGAVYMGSQGSQLTLTSASSVGIVIVDSDKQDFTLKSDSRSTVKKLSVDDVKAKLVIAAVVKNAVITGSGYSINFNGASVTTANLGTESNAVDIDATSDISDLNLSGTKMTVNNKGTVEDVIIGNGADKLTFTTSEDIDRIDILSRNVKCTVNSGARVDEVFIDGEDCLLSGSGEVKDVTVNGGGDNAEITTRNTKVVNKSGGTIKVGGVSVYNGSTSTTNSSGTNTSKDPIKPNDPVYPDNPTDNTYTQSSAGMSVPSITATASDLGAGCGMDKIASSLSLSGSSFTGTVLDCRTNLTRADIFSNATKHFFVPMVLNISGVRSSTTAIVNNRMWTYSNAYRTSGPYSGKFVVFAELDPTMEGYADANIIIKVDTDGADNAQYRSTSYTLSYRSLTFSKVVTDPDIDLPESVVTTSVLSSAEETTVGVGDNNKYGFSSLTATTNISTKTVTVTGTVYNVKGTLPGYGVAAVDGMYFPLKLKLSMPVSNTTVVNDTTNGKYYDMWHGYYDNTCPTETLKDSLVIWIPVSADKLGTDKAITTVVADTDGSNAAFGKTTYKIDWRGITIGTLVEDSFKVSLAKQVCTTLSMTGTAYDKQTSVGAVKLTRPLSAYAHGDAIWSEATNTATLTGNVYKGSTGANYYPVIFTIAGLDTTTVDKVLLNTTELSYFKSGSELLVMVPAVNKINTLDININVPDSSAKVTVSATVDATACVEKNISVNGWKPVVTGSTEAGDMSSFATVLNSFKVAAGDDTASYLLSSASPLNSAGTLTGRSHYMPLVMPGSSGTGDYSVAIDGITTNSKTQGSYGTWSLALAKAKLSATAMPTVVCYIDKRDDSNLGCGLFTLGTSSATVSAASFNAFTPTQLTGMTAAIPSGNVTDILGTATTTVLEDNTLSLTLPGITATAEKNTTYGTGLVATWGFVAPENAAYAIVTQSQPSELDWVFRSVDVTTKHVVTDGKISDVKFNIVDLMSGEAPKKLMIEWFKADGSCLSTNAVQVKKNDTQFAIDMTANSLAWLKAPTLSAMTADDATAANLVATVDIATLGTLGTARCNSGKAITSPPLFTTGTAEFTGGSYDTVTVGGVSGNYIPLKVTLPGLSLDKASSYTVSIGKDDGSSSAPAFIHSAYDASSSTVSIYFLYKVADSNGTKYGGNIILKPSGSEDSEGEYSMRPIFNNVTLR